ncbi:MAG: hypothetical protein ABH891_08855 [Candidatus Omnitrophota bacterium]
MFQRNIFAGLLILTLILAPCAYAGKVEYPTLYPSPNGEYQYLNSWNDSYFATLSGNVGIGMSSGASVKLEVAAPTAIKVGQAYLSPGSGTSISLATNTWYNGSAWQFPGAVAGTELYLTTGNADIWYHNGAGGWTQWANVSSTAGWAAGCAQVLKQNIHTLTLADYALLREEFRATDLFSYNRKDIPTEPEVGFIAEHAPDLILDKTKTQVPLIKGIGYLAAIMKAQENVLVPLEKEVRDLKHEILASGVQQHEIDTLQKEVEKLKNEFVCLEF